jgi:hypothetical protein
MSLMQPGRAPAQPMTRVDVPASETASCCFTLPIPRPARFVCPAGHGWLPVYLITSQQRS